MSLQTDSYFYTVISGTAEIMSAVAGRIYSTDIAVPDEGLDNVPVPYMVITNEGTANDTSDKDDVGESHNDIDTVNVIIVASSRSALASLASAVRRAVRRSFAESLVDTEADGYTIDDYTFKASPVVMDVYKPCYMQTLIYVCDTTNNYI